MEMVTVSSDRLVGGGDVITIRRTGHHHDNEGDVVGDGDAIADEDDDSDRDDNYGVDNGNV